MHKNFKLNIAISTKPASVKLALLIQWHLLLLIIVLNPLILLAQTYPTRNFTMRDGLPSMGIRCIYKDTRGLLWIGTDAGLSTFDGKSFRIFKPSEGMTASQIWAITEDESGNMWFGSFGEGIYKYNGRIFKQFTTKNGLVENEIRVIEWSKKYDCLVAAGYEGISVISCDTIKSIKAGDLGPRSRRYAFTGVIDAGEFLYITNYHANTLYRFYPDKMEGKIVNDTDSIYPAYSFSGLIMSNGDTVFTNNEQGIRIKKGRKFTDVNCTGQIFDMSEDKRGNIWFAVWSYPGRNFDSGIYMYDGKTLKNYKNAIGTTDKEIWTVYCDKEQDVVWVGTLNEGLFRIPNSGIEKFPPSFFNLDKNSIADLFIDSKDRLWISGNKELIVMDSMRNYSTIPKAQMIRGYKQFWNKHNFINFYLGSNPGLEELKILSLPDSKINEIATQFTFNFNRVTEDNNNSVYFTNKLGLNKITGTQTDVKFLGYIGNSFDIDFYGEDTLLSTCWGPTLITPHINNINSILPDSQFHFLKEKNDSIARGKPLDVNRLVKKGQQFWYATMFSGLWMSEKMQLVHFNKTDSTISNSLNDICFDEFGHIIFGSNTGEICIASYQDDSLNIKYRISKESGLTGNSITWLAADQKGKLWAGTNLGLNCIDLDSLYQNGKPIFRFMDEEEGYTGHTSKRARIDNSGNLWMGAGDQLIRLSTTDFLSIHLNIGKVILKSFDINNSPIDSTLKSKLDPWTWLPLNNIDLSHNQNNLIFYFDVLNYNNELKDKFRYKLEGYETNAGTWTNERRAVYTNLPPGKYTLVVESYNLFTISEAIPLEFSFTIKPPWWHIWYVQFLFIAFVAAILVLAIRTYNYRRRNKQLQKLEVEKTIAQLETQALQAQMNPHFIFNCMNGIQYFVLANKMDEVLAYLSDFSKVVSQSLGSASLHMVPLEQEIDFLKSYLRLEQMRFPDKFDFDIRCFEGVDAGIVFLPPMLVQSFAENAIRHGFVNLKRKGHISIDFEVEERDLLKCSITDNGIGREKGRLKTDATQKNDRLHSGAITETRIRLFNTVDFPNRYKIVYTDLTEKGKSCGLKVELYLPMETGGVIV